MMGTDRGGIIRPGKGEAKPDLYNPEPKLIEIVDRVAAITFHLHTKSRWAGAKAGADETNAADFDTETPFTVTSGTGDWGTALCVVGSGDTPSIEGSTHINIHRMMVVDVGKTTVYRVRVAFGDSYDAAIAAGDFTEIIFQTADAMYDKWPIDILAIKVPVGTKIWVNARTGPVAGAISFFVGLHEAPSGY